MAIRTKLARRVLNKTQQRHLTEMGIGGMAAFRETRAHQIKMNKEGQENNLWAEACWECREIAEKLGVE